MQAKTVIGFETTLRANLSSIVWDDTLEQQLYSVFAKHCINLIETYPIEGINKTNFLFVMTNDTDDIRAKIFVDVDENFGFMQLFISQQDMEIMSNSPANHQKDFFLSAVISMVAHESYHWTQYCKSYHEIDPQEITSQMFSRCELSTHLNNNENSELIYLSNDKEIAAHAFTAGAEIMLFFKDTNKALDFIRNEEESPNAAFWSMYNHYFKKSTHKNAIKVLNRYKRHVYEYIKNCA